MLIIDLYQADVRVSRGMMGVVQVVTKMVSIYTLIFGLTLLYVISLYYMLFRLPRWSSGHEVAGSIPGTFTNFKCGLGLERGPPSLVRTIG